MIAKTPKALWGKKVKVIVQEKKRIPSKKISAEKGGTEDKNS